MNFPKYLLSVYLKKNKMKLSQNFSLSIYIKNRENYQDLIYYNFFKERKL